MIKGNKVTLKISNKVILDDVSFEIKKDGISAFIGKSGAGKTSLLKCIINLNDSYLGTITLKDKNIKELSNKEKAKCIGFVCQHFNLFSHMTVFNNCLHPMIVVLNMSKKIAEQKVEEILQLLGISELKNMYPAKISGGQQQRVAIARALCLGSEFLLLDEPTSALDPESTKSLCKLLKDLCNKGIKIAFSSHDMNFVKELADNIYFLEDGKVVDFCSISKDFAFTHNSKISDFLNHS